MYITGTTVGPYLRMTREHLRKEHLLVHVPDTKNAERDRWVAVDERLWHWVERAIPAPLKTKQLRRHWNDAVARVGIEDFKMGDSRHLAAQFAGDEGVTDRDLAIYLGHTNPTMSHRYSRTPTARKVGKAVADRLLA